MCTQHCSLEFIFWVHQSWFHSHSNTAINLLQSFSKKKNCCVVGKKTLEPKNVRFRERERGRRSSSNRTFFWAFRQKKSRHQVPKQVNDSDVMFCCNHLKYGFIRDFLFKSVIFLGARKMYYKGKSTIN